MEEGKRKNELDRFYLSLFTFDEIILRGLTAVKVRPFSGSVNRKKIVTPRSWTKRAGPGHARLSGTETGNLFGELHPVAFLVFPSVSPTYLCAPPECPMFLFRFFFFFSLTFEEEWNLEAGPSSSRLESSVRHSFLYLLQLFQVLETRRRFFMKYTRFIKGEENFFLKLEQQ